MPTMNAFFRPPLVPAGGMPGGTEWTLRLEHKAGKPGWTWLRVAIPAITDAADGLTQGQAQEGWKLLGKHAGRGWPLTWAPAYALAHRPPLGLLWRR